MLTGPSWLCSRSSLPSTNSRRGLSQAQSIHGSASGKRPEGCRPAIAGKADKSLQRHASSRADGRERRLIWHLPSLHLCVSARTNFFLRAETQKRREKGWRLRRGEESCRHRSIAFALELAGEFCAAGAHDAAVQEDVDEIGADIFEQIGRASCRERVCQYV